MLNGLKSLLEGVKRTAGKARFRLKATPAGAPRRAIVELRDGPETSSAAKSPVVFRRYIQYPNLFEFNLDKLDINLLIYPKTGVEADRDAVLLIVFGCEEILALDEVNEAYVCRKLSQARGSRDEPAPHSFDAAYSTAARFNAQDIVNACVEGVDLERVSSAAGGGIRLTAYARQISAELAFDLNRA